MVPVEQRNLHKPEEGVWGDCHRAAIASVLELPLDDVPHFGHGGPDGEEFRRRERAFCLARGLVPLSVIYQADAGLDAVLRCIGQTNPGVYWLLGGRSKTGVDHTVVCFEGEIAHDPSINKSGIVGPCDDGFYWATYFGAAVAVKKSEV